MYISRPYPKGVSRSRRLCKSHEQKVQRAKVWYVHGHEYKHKGGLIGGGVNPKTRNCSCGMQLVYVGSTKKATHPL